MSTQYAQRKRATIHLHPAEIVQPGQINCGGPFLPKGIEPTPQRLRCGVSSGNILSGEVTLVRMRNLRMMFAPVCLVLLLLLPALGQKAASAAKPDPTKPVRDAFERLLEGIRQADAAKVMSVYDNSPRTLFFNNNGTVTLGWETMKNNRESSYQKTKDVALEVKGVRVEMLGPAAAYISCTWTQSQIYDGKLENAAGRMTLIFKKVGKEWKVVHLHTSPSVPAADRPILDSEKTTQPAKQPSQYE